MYNLTHLYADDFKRTGHNMTGIVYHKLITDIYGLQFEPEPVGPGIGPEVVFIVVQTSILIRLESQPPGVAPANAQQP